MHGNSSYALIRLANAGFLYREGRFYTQCSAVIDGSVTGGGPLAARCRRLLLGIRKLANNGIARSGDLTLIVVERHLICAQ